jgi:putative DNA primase/helicase
MNQFKNAMYDRIGYAPETIIGDGYLHRVKDESGKLNGAYVLHLDGRAAGYFEDFKQGIKERWKMDGDIEPPTAAERKAFAIDRQRKQAERETEEKGRHDKAIRKAAFIWSRSTPAINHPYLVKKRIKPHTARFYRGSLIIPLYDENGLLVSLQFIGDDGSKRMMKGGKAQGSSSPIGDGLKTDIILICEGWATGASLHEATGHLTLVAFSAGNLKAIAAQTRKKYLESEIIICGDNDLSGVGQKAAREAALICGGKYILPATIGHDWNDVLPIEVNSHD